MTIFDPLLHPRAAGGRFSASTQSPPEVSLSCIKPPRLNSLLLRAPLVANEWDWDSELNSDATPANTPFSSNKPRGWVCALGHRWPTSPNKRTSKNGTNCPECAKVNAWSPHTPKPGQSFQDRSPEAASEWAYDLNGGVSPWEVTHSSNQSYFFRCRVCAHVWPSPLNSRTAGQGCPPCGIRSATVIRRQPKPGKSFADVSPDAAAEWDVVRNGAVTPDQVRFGSPDLYWFLCAVCSHSWETSLKARSLGQGCRPCTLLRLADMYSTPPAGKSLGDLFPATSAEWDDVGNGDVTPFDRYPASNIMAQWKCAAKSHRWPATPNDRTISGSGCPKCSTSGTSNWEKSVSTALVRLGVPVQADHPKIDVPGRRRPVAADLVIPAWGLVVELDGNRWHGFPESAATDARQTAHLESAGWDVIRVRAQLPVSGPNDLVLQSKSPSAKETTIALVAHLASLGYSTPDADDVLGFDYGSLDASTSTFQLAAAATTV